MTTHPMSRHLTRAFLYTSGQEGVWETLRPTAGDEVRSFHPQLITSLLAIGHLQLLSETVDAIAGVSAFSSKEHMGTLAWDVSMVTQPLILFIKTSKMSRICNWRQQSPYERGDTVLPPRERAWQDVLVLRWGWCRWQAYLLCADVRHGWH